MTNFIRHLLMILLGFCLVGLGYALVYKTPIFQTVQNQPGLSEDQMKISETQDPKNNNDSAQASSSRLSADAELNMLISMAKKMLAEQNWNYAEMYALKALVKNAQSAEALYCLGISRYRMERYEEAALALEKTLQLQDDPAVRYSLGVLYLYYLGQATKGTNLLHSVVNDGEANDELKSNASRLLSDNAAKESVQAAKAPESMSIDK
ncbi:MAG: tetratricopeptide repeat protein [Desulfovibrionaceae bacterium]|nr:tetratricopeptide repeat protein [Desulfovibrionaceae bacterium]